MFQNRSVFFLIFLMVFGLVPVSRSSALSFGPKAKTFVGAGLALAGFGGAWYCHSQERYCQDYEKYCQEELEKLAELIEESESDDDSDASDKKAKLESNKELYKNLKGFFKKLKFGSGAIGFAGAALAIWGGYEWFSCSGGIQYEVKSKLFGKFDVTAHKDGSFTVNGKKVSAEKIKGYIDCEKKGNKPKMTDKELDASLIENGSPVFGCDKAEIRKVADSMFYAVRDKKEFSLEAKAFVAVLMS